MAGAILFLLSAAVFFLLLLLPHSPAFARVRPPGFTIPSRMLPFGEAVTPGEYAQLIAAINAWEGKHANALDEGEGLGNLDDIKAAHVSLGSLGEGMIVSFGNSAPPCGATGNCPMALLVPGSKGYRLAIMAGGWGYALLSSGNSVPDIAFYSNVSCCESTAGRFHYAKGNFAQVGGASCTDKNSSNPLCAPLHSSTQTLQQQGAISPVEYNSQILDLAVSPAEYKALRRAVEASPTKQAATLLRQAPFQDAHALEIGRSRDAATAALALGPCGDKQNCRVSIYDLPYRGGGSWPLLSDVSAWGVAGFVIARRLSPSQDELTSYRAPLSYPPQGGQGKLLPGSHLLPQACEIVSPKTGHWPAPWDAAALVAQPVSCFNTSAPKQVPIPEADPTTLSAAVQDSTGTVWATGNGPGPFRLYRWRNGAWSQAPSPMPPSSSSPQQLASMEASGQIPGPIGLWPGPNGGLLVDWLDPPTRKSELFWQRGDRAKLLGEIPPVYGAPSSQTGTVAWAASGIIVIAGGQSTWRNGVPVSGQAASIFRLGRNGQLKRIYAIAGNQYLPFQVDRNFPMFSAAPQLKTTRDGKGRIWIWSRSEWFNTRLGIPALEGFLVTNGKTVQYHRQIPGLPSRLVGLYPWDKNHLVAASERRLYLIDTAKFTASLIRLPPPNLFRILDSVSIVNIGHDHYVLTPGPGSREPDYPPSNTYLNGALWRFRDGEWTQILNNAGNTTGSALATPDGLWLGTAYRGLWFVPWHGSPRRVNWRQGLSIASVGQLFQLPDGAILATDAGESATTRSVEFQPASLPAQPAPSTNFSVIHPLSGLVPDARHNLWGILSPGVLSEWNGSGWIPHPFPLGTVPARIVGLDVDTLGRVWLFPNCQLGPMGIFDPTQGSWTTYTYYGYALRGQVRPVKFLHPKDDRLRPIYGPNSQIVFVGMCGGVNYFDGERWRIWDSFQLPGRGQRNAAIPPFFDRAGHLAIDAHSVTWQWTRNAGWEQTGYEPREPVPQGFFEVVTGRAPIEEPPGYSFWVANDTLCEGSREHPRVVLSGSKPQPFIDGRQLVRVLRDARGNALLETLWPFSYIIVPSSDFARKPQTARKPPRAAHH